MTREQVPAPEFSRSVAADQVGRDGLDLVIEATEAERAALARRFGLVSLDALSAACRLRAVAGGMIELAATFDARVVQECVVTLEPVAAMVHGTVEQRYALDPGVMRSFGADEEIDLEADDPPEALEAGAIDVGEAVAQQLAVTLDPYPRAPDVNFAGVVGGTDPIGRSGTAERERRPSPFAALSKLKK